MSNRADGSIVIDTRLDNSGFSRGSREMESAINSLQRQVDALGRRMDSTFSDMQRSINESTRTMQEQTQAQEQAQFEPLIEEALQNLKITHITPEMEI